MARPKDPALERAWRQRIRRQTLSPLAISDFCAREGVSCSSFHAWKRRLTPRPLPDRTVPPLFVPLHLDTHPLDRNSTLGRRVEIELPHQVRLHFDYPPEPEWLGRVVAAIAAIATPEATP
jgi:hypothetical protein